MSLPCGNSVLFRRCVHHRGKAQRAQLALAVLLARRLETPPAWVQGNLSPLGAASVLCSPHAVTSVCHTQGLIPQWGPIHGAVSMTLAGMCSSSRSVWVTSFFTPWVQSIQESPGYQHAVFKRECVEVGMTLPSP